MAEKQNITRSRRRPEDAATIGVMLLKALLVVPPDNPAPVVANPRSPVLAGGVLVVLLGRLRPPFSELNFSQKDSPLKVFFIFQSEPAGFVNGHRPPC